MYTSPPLPLLARRPPLTTRTTTETGTAHILHLAASCSRHHPRGRMRATHAHELQRAAATPGMRRPSLTRRRAASPPPRCPAAAAAAVVTTRSPIDVSRRPSPRLIAKPPLPSCARAAVTAPHRTTSDRRSSTRISDAARPAVSRKQWPGRRRRGLAGKGRSHARHSVSQGEATRELGAAGPRAEGLCASTLSRPPLRSLLVSGSVPPPPVPDHPR